MPRKRKAKKTNGGASTPPKVNKKFRKGEIIVQPKAPRQRAPKLQAQLSVCARDYALAVRDPFTGPLACLPSNFPPLPSLKVRTWSKGTFTVGTTAGGVSVSPNRFSANDGSSVVFSSAAGYASASPWLGTGGANTTTQNSNSPYAQASFGTGTGQVQYRMVGMGMRAWCISPEVDLGGDMIAFREPDNNSIANLTEDQIMAYTNVRRIPCDAMRTPALVCWIPTTPSEMEFGSTPTAGAACLGIAVFGAKAGNKFSFEIFQVLEFIGSTVLGKTQSHADPEGFAAVLEAVEEQGDSWYGSAKNAGIKLVQAATEHLSHLSGNVLRKAGAAALEAAAYGVMNRMRGALGEQPARLAPGSVTVTEIDRQATHLQSPSVPKAPEIALPKRTWTQTDLGLEYANYSPAEVKVALNAINSRDYRITSVVALREVTDQVLVELFGRPTTPDREEAGYHPPGDLPYDPPRK